MCNFLRDIRGYVTVLEARELNWQNQQKDRSGQRDEDIELSSLPMTNKSNLSCPLAKKEAISDQEEQARLQQDDDDDSSKGSSLVRDVKRLKSATLERVGRVFGKQQQSEKVI